MEQEKKVKKSSFLMLMALTLGSRILGMVRVMIQSRYIGGGALNDAFNVANTIPNLLRKLFAESSMTVAFIPTFKGYLKDNNKTETRLFLNSIFTTLTFLVTLTVILGIILTPVLVLFLDKGNADISEVILLTRIMFPYLALISIAALFMGILNSLNIFGPGGLAPILFNIVVISLTLILSRYTQNPARAMAIGITVGGLSQLIIQLPFVIKNGFRPSFVGLKIAFSHPGTKKVGRLIAPTLLGMGVYELNTVVANFIAYNTGEGVSSSLTYSIRLQELVLGIFAVSIGTVLISTLSKNVKDGNWETYSSSIAHSLSVIALLTIPVSIFSIINSTEIVELIYKSGNFGEKELLMTSSVFKIHIGGVFFIAITRILGPAFYSLEDSKTPAILSSLSLGLSIVLMFILAPFLKGDGIALAVTVSSVVLMILYFVFMRKRKEINFKEISKRAIPSFIRITFYSILAAIPLILLKPVVANFFNNPNKALRLIPGLTVLTLVYFGFFVILILVFKEKSVKTLLSLSKKGK
jgi:putative peptidoglycan lipid II flippase